MQHLNSRQSTTKPPAAKELRHTTMLSFGVQMSEPFECNNRKIDCQKDSKWLIQWLPCLLCLLSLLALRASVSVKIMAQPKPSLRGVKANVTPLSWAKMEQQDAACINLRKTGTSIDTPVLRAQGTPGTKTLLGWGYIQSTGVNELPRYVSACMTNWWDFSGMQVVKPVKLRSILLSQLLGELWLLMRNCERAVQMGWTGECVREPRDHLTAWLSFGHMAKRPLRKNLCEVNRKHTREP